MQRAMVTIGFQDLRHLRHRLKWRYRVEMKINRVLTIVFQDLLSFILQTFHVIQ